MDALVWILLPGFVAVGTGLLVFFIMQSRMEVELAQQREATAEARGALEAQRKSYEETLRGAEEAGRRKAFDEFLADIRIEQRHYVRQHRTLFRQRKSLILEERMFFRTLPLSNWIEHEILIEEGSDVDRLARSLSVFDPGVLALNEPKELRVLPN